MLKQKSMLGKYLYFDDDENNAKHFLKIFNVKENT